MREQAGGVKVSHSFSRTMGIDGGMIAKDFHCLGFGTLSNVICCRLEGEGRVLGLRHRY